MTGKLTEKAKQLGINPTVCNWFQFFAQETWDRIGYARTRKGLKIHEPTITQNLIFEFHTSRDLYGPKIPNTWGIEILESINERANGNDIELFVETTDGILFFAVQAKIIHHFTDLKNGNYKNLIHESGKKYQIDLLCNYATEKKGIPLYLLYNYVKSTFEKNKKCNIDFEIEQYGCSIISAKKVKTNYSKDGVWTIPTFLDLHPKHALPWFVIPCCFQNKSKSEILEMLGEKEIDISEIKLYNLDEIRSDKNWKSLQTFSEENFISNQLSEYESQDFNPRFRVILSPELSKKNIIKS